MPALHLGPAQGWSGSDAAAAQNRSSVCKACKFGAHSAHTCGTRGAGTGTKQDRITAALAAESSLFSVSERARKSSEGGTPAPAAYATRRSHGIRVLSMRARLLSGQSASSSPSAHASPGSTGYAASSSSRESSVSPSPPQSAGAGRTVAVEQFGGHGLSARDYNCNTMGHRSMTTNTIPIPHMNLNPASRRQVTTAPPTSPRAPCSSCPCTPVQEHGTLHHWAFRLRVTASCPSASRQLRSTCCPLAPSNSLADGGVLFCGNWTGVRVPASVRPASRPEAGTPDVILRAVWMDGRDRARRPDVPCWHRPPRSPVGVARKRFDSSAARLRQLWRARPGAGWHCLQDLRHPRGLRRVHPGSVMAARAKI